MFAGQQDVALLVVGDRGSVSGVAVLGKFHVSRRGWLIGLTQENRELVCVGSRHACGDAVDPEPQCECHDCATSSRFLRGAHAPPMTSNAAQWEGFASSPFPSRSIFNCARRSASAASTPSLYARWNSVSSRSAYSSSIGATVPTTVGTEAAMKARAKLIAPSLR